MIVWTASVEIQEVQRQASKSKATMVPFHQGSCIPTWTRAAVSAGPRDSNNWSNNADINSYENRTTAGASGVKWTSRVCETLTVGLGSNNIGVTSITHWCAVINCLSNISSVAAVKYQIITGTLCRTLHPQMSWQCNLKIKQSRYMTTKIYWQKLKVHFWSRKQTVSPQVLLLCWNSSVSHNLFQLELFNVSVTKCLLMVGENGLVCYDLSPNK